MQKPNGYDEAQAGGEFTPVDLGGHYAIVKQVGERKSSTGKDMIVVLFDFILPDKQPGYFSEEFKNDTRQDKKWPYQGSMYILVNDYNDHQKTSRSFKTFCTCVEKSNNYTIQWGGGSWAQQFKNKKIGVVFGEVENEYEGNISMRRNARWFCAWDKVKEANIPAPKYLNGSGPAAPTNNAPNTTDTTTKSDTGIDGFLNLPEGCDDEIPF